MSIYILDTDHVSLLLQGNQAVSSRAAQVYPDLALTIVTVQEIFNGWIVKINNSAQSSNLVRLYTNLWTTVEFFKDTIEQSTPTLHLIRFAFLGRTQNLVFALGSKGILEEKFYNS